jgi:hypothetical protein
MAHGAKHSDHEAEEGYVETPSRSRRRRSRS